MSYDLQNINDESLVSLCYKLLTEGYTELEIGSTLIQKKVDVEKIKEALDMAKSRMLLALPQDKAEMRARLSAMRMNIVKVLSSKEEPTNRDFEVVLKALRDIEVSQDLKEEDKAGRTILEVMDECEVIEED